MRTNLALLVLSALAAIACSDDSTSSPSNQCANSGAADTVSATDSYAYTPDSVTITVGQSVCWQNTGQLMHTVTEYAGRFNGSLPGGQTFVHTYTFAGSFPYYCQQHSNMAGTVVVNP